MRYPKLTRSRKGKTTNKMPHFMCLRNQAGVGRPTSFHQRGSRKYWSIWLAGSPDPLQGTQL
eukprot:NODE_27391_length_515_cov_5.373711.p3 GENE.NODE_27391_length_515_cov_5.373711~~NODE_27391_length_515_cov_5.373711.p3  ORF type:complete len:62 (-),score=1.00 NODE_27391_length_515_cov_5.373711:23-208(-)